MYFQPKKIYFQAVKLYFQGRKNKNEGTFESFMAMIRLIR